MLLTSLRMPIPGLQLLEVPLVKTSLGGCPVKIIVEISALWSFLCYTEKLRKAICQNFHAFFLILLPLLVLGDPFLVDLVYLLFVITRRECNQKVLLPNSGGWFAINHYIDLCMVAMLGDKQKELTIAVGLITGILS